MKQIAAPEFRERLVPRFPAAQTSQACAEPAAPAVDPCAAGAAFCHFTETAGVGARHAAEAAPAAFHAGAATDALRGAAAIGQGQTTPSGQHASASGVVVSLSPAVALILKLVSEARCISADEAISRAICIYADRVGLPSLARTALEEIGDDGRDLRELGRRDGCGAQEARRDFLHQELRR